MSHATTTAPDPYAVALLRGGDRAAVTAALAGLQLRGVVEAGRPGTVRRTGVKGAVSFRHPLEKAVRTSLYRPAGPRELPAREVVRRALARMRAELVAQGLLRALPPGRTRTGRRHLAELRERHALPDGPAGPDGLAEDAVLFAVALYGERALTAVLPRFAREAGLVGRGALADEGRFPFSRGNDIRLLRHRADDGILFDLDGDDRDHGGGSVHHGHGGSAHGHDHGGGSHGHDYGGGCGGGGYG
ncbi:TIGR04222 domain-containing membrane protein [Streptomyces sp. NPDC006012]|uniref:TIGR04222 domain-containing membrane protein n=1 Tax=Streptomyces sp. NPDC006012 TaxID=3364739 RepID=UPI00368366A8